MKLLLCFLLAVVPFASAEYWSKRWALEGTAFSAGLTMLSYLISSICWLAIMRISNKLFVMGVAWQPIGCGIAFVIGVCCFGERLHWTELVGVGIALVAVAFLVLGPTIVQGSPH